MGSFYLSINPISYPLRSKKGYPYGKNHHHQYIHNFFVDGLKLYLTNMMTVKRQLEIVIIFSKDIGMKFREDRCTLLHIDKVLIKKS